MHKINQIFAAIVFLALAVLSFAHGMRTNNIYLQFLPIVLLIGIYAFSKPEYIFLIALAIMNSRLVLPGFPGDLELYHVLFFLSATITLSRKIITKEHSRSDQVLFTLGAIYTIIVFYTMLFRGIGFRILGTDQSGGMRYILIYLGFLNLWLLPNLRIDYKKLKYTLVIFALLSFLPVLAEGILLASGGMIYHHYYFFRPDFGLGGALLGTLEGANVRYMSAAILGRGLVYLPFFIFFLNRKNFPLTLLLMIAGIIILTFSGFRSVLIGTLIFLFFAGYFIFERQRKVYLTVFLFSLLLGYTVIWFSFDFLPYGIQRAVAFLPLVGDGSLAFYDGQGTMNFRLNVWSLAWDDVPNHLWLGRGLAFDAAEMRAIQMSYWDSHLIFMYGFLTNLHNGPLEVLYYLGIPAVLVFFPFMGRLAYLSYQSMAQPDHYKRDKQLFIFFGSLIIAQISMFLLSFGNPYGTFYSFCLNISLIQIIQQSYSSNENTSQ